MNIAVRFAHRLGERGTDTAIVSADGTTTSYEELATQTRRVAAWVDAQGLGVGDRVAVYLPDTPAYLPTM
ncbi:MAG: AMP-binding protein, partial [Haloarculaceae archaeon]